MKASPAVRPLFRSGRSGIIIGILGCGVFTSGLNAQMTDDELSAHDTAFFESKIRPLLIEHCYDCHASDAERIRGGLVLDTREGWQVGGISGPAIVPGDPDASLLIESIRWEDEDFQMPPRRKLSDSDISLLEEWVRRGAPDPRVPLLIGEDEARDLVVPGGGVPKEAGLDHWAFQPIDAPAIPTVKNSRWAESDIDHFILAQLERRELRAAPDAIPETLIRRLSFDLRGIQPTPEEIEAFVSDRSPTAYEALVDSYLDAPEFGERWGRHWLDVARYAESSGKELDVPYAYAWRYRDWVIKAFNEDMPYDDFVRLQIAGDLLPSRTVEAATDQLIATGYLAIGSKSHQERNRQQFILDVADEQIDTITQGMLGLTVACARCHDHKYDPISQKDYYQLAGVFISSETLFGGSATNRSMSSGIYTLPERADIPLGMPIPVEIRDRLASQVERTEGGIERLRAQLAEEGRGSAAAQMLRQANNRLLPLREAMERYDADGQPTKVMYKAMGCRERETHRDANLLIRGELDQPSDRVPRGIPPIANLKDPQLIASGSGRLEFANWIASDRNPLTARVMVNRIWLHLFGSGLVASTENFGLEGQPPTHPALLDHLSTRFIASDWSTKSLIREIVTSHTYRMSSRSNAAGMRVDPDNTSYWRMSPRRLEGEAIRDAILVASGTLDPNPQVGSPVAWSAGRAFGEDTLEQYTPDNHRSVYLAITRGSVPAFLDAFDAAEPSFVTGNRDETSVPSQALYLLNDPWVMKQADHMASELLAMKGTDEDRVEVAFLRALGREPTASERASVRSFFRDFGRLDSNGDAFVQPEGVARFEETLSRNSQRRAAVLRRLRERGRNIPEPLDTREVAWSSFCQSLFACAEFRYVN
jgi:hypothetical protein